ncbi:MAG: YciI family protein [Natronosporangium sp.]
MKYLLLIYNNPTSKVGEPESAAAQRLQGHVSLYRELASAGKVVSSAALPDPPQVSTLQVRGGVPAVTDGPYLEAKEYLAGYYLVDVDTLDEAAEIATRIPCGAAGAVEIRPINEEVTNLVRGEAG